MHLILDLRATKREEVESVRSIGSIPYSAFEQVLRPVFLAYGIPEDHFPGIDMEINDYEFDD